MSTSFNAYALIGVCLSKESWENGLKPEPIVEEKPGCACNAEFSKKKFCPECGQPNLVKVVINQKEIDKFNTYDAVEKLAKSLKLKMACGYDGDFYCIGVGSGPAGNYEPDAIRMEIRNIDLVVIETKLRKALAPLGLWDENEFGLWAVQYVG